MIEQMKNSNEYREDGKLFIKTIHRCKCIRKDGEEYRLECKIHQRGFHEYIYQKGTDYISKWGTGKKLWLSEEAKAEVEKETDAFDTMVLSAEAGGFRKIDCEDCNLKILFKGRHDRYDIILKYENEKTEQITTEVFYEKDLEYILHYLKFCIDISDSESKDLFLKPTAANISNHPFIIEARKNNDVITEINIKLFYHLETAEDCALLEALLGLRILPMLSQEFNKEYVIDVRTMTKDAYDLLLRSGYVISHRPYFAMRGSTHSRITVNPHTKYAVDAAKVEEPVISFESYLELFD